MKVLLRFKQFDSKHAEQQFPSKEPKRNKVTSTHAAFLNADTIRKLTFSN